jgi:NAD(P)H-hydrate epimerase
MKLHSSADVRAADQAAERAGVAPATLMEAAGRAVADDARAAWPDARRPWVLCGPGNNGGDGYVAARHLARAGYAPTVLAVRPDGSKGEAAEAARRDWRPHGEILALDAQTLADALARADLIVDALFGTGLSRALHGPAAEAARALADWSGPVLAVDVPSGVDADVAVPPGEHVRATRTVQLAAACPASALAPARFAFGTWRVADIGLPDAALPAEDRPRLVEDAAAAAALPRRSPDAHKYRAGTVLIAAGSGRWAGAAELACRGAHRGGAGLVTLASDAPFPGRWPETVLQPVDQAPGALAAALAAVEPRHAAARVLGPGLDPARVAELAEGLAASPAPTVLDASALDPRLQEAVRRHGGCWLTPHVGEAARLRNEETGAVRRDPIAAARGLADAWSATVVLKGAGAVVAAPDGRVRVVAGGDPAMASGGTGDVLAGLLGAALAAPHDDPLERGAAAVLLHARAGERAARRRGAGLRASDLADAIPAARRALGGGW